MQLELYRNYDEYTENVNKENEKKHKISFFIIDLMTCKKVYQFSINSIPESDLELYLDEYQSYYSEVKEIKA